MNQGRTQAKARGIRRGASWPGSCVCLDYASRQNYLRVKFVTVSSGFAKTLNIALAYSPFENYATILAADLSLNWGLNIEIIIVDKEVR